MSAYIDTSALAKCYIREPRSLDVLDWADAQDGVDIFPRMDARQLLDRGLGRDQPGEAREFLVGQHRRHRAQPVGPLRMIVAGIVLEE